MTQQLPFHWEPASAPRPPRFLVVPERRQRAITGEGRPWSAGPSQPAFLHASSTPKRPDQAASGSLLGLQGSPPTRRPLFCCHCACSQLGESMEGHQKQSRQGVGCAGHVKRGDAVTGVLLVPWGGAGNSHKSSPRGCESCLVSLSSPESRQRPKTHRVRTVKAGCQIKGTHCPSLSLPAPPHALYRSPGTRRVPSTDRADRHGVVYLHIQTFQGSPSAALAPAMCKSRMTSPSAK